MIKEHGFVEILDITPAPTVEEREAIVQAFDLAWPKPPVPQQQKFPDWRFSKRWWNVNKL